MLYITLGGGGVTGFMLYITLGGGVTGREGVTGVVRHVGGSMSIDLIICLKVMFN